MNKNNNNSRREKILELIIEDYINTASPISSRTISHRLRRSLSPATIRNIMADLEDAQLITHPHTSAGRMPTNKGYRHYVNTLMQVKLLTEEEKKRITDSFRRKFEEIDEVIINTSRLLSSIAEEAGLVTFPVLERNSFDHIELIQIDRDKVLAVFLTKSGLIKNIIVEFEKPLKKYDLGKITNLLNTKFSGVSLSDIRKTIIQQLLLERDSFFYILDETKHIVDLMLNTIRNRRICLDGASRIVMQPEFKNLKKVENLLAALENPDILEAIVEKTIDSNSVAIYIGDEIDIEGLADCGLIISSYSIGDDHLGALGIVGPKRMQYGKMVSLVNYISKMLGEILE